MKQVRYATWKFHTCAFIFLSGSVWRGRGSIVNNYSNRQFSMVISFIIDECPKIPYFITKHYILSSTEIICTVTPNEINCRCHREILWDKSLLSLVMKEHHVFLVCVSTGIDYLVISSNTEIVIKKWKLLFKTFDS